VSERTEFAEFYATSRDNCLRAVLASTGDQRLAEDAVAEAFARAWVSWRTVSRHPAPQAWVVRSALNLHVSSWRRRRREVSLSAAGQDRAQLPEGSGHVDEVDPQIMAMLAALPQRQRQVVALRIFLDLDTGSTAEALDIAPGTVRAHLTRAMATLRSQLSLLSEPEARP
jgi:RNA polymerase sigma factor (sigma-70 family)